MQVLLEGVGHSLQKYLHACGMEWQVIAIIKPLGGGGGMVAWGLLMQTAPE